MNPILKKVLIVLGALVGLFLIVIIVFILQLKNATKDMVALQSQEIAG